jgi:hypothetical protein
MESALLGLVLDSNSVITAERKRQAACEVYRSKAAEVGQRRREYVEELLSLIIFSG